MDKYRKLISNTFIFAVGTFSSKVLVFLLMPLYTNVLSEEQFGMVDLMVQVGNFLLPVVSCDWINTIKKAMFLPPVFSLSLPDSEFYCCLSRCFPISLI